MSKKSQKPGTTPQESKVHKIHGIEVFGRKGPDGRFNNLDAIDVDERKIRNLADILQHKGFGVMRMRKARSGKVYYLFKATWARPGDPPEHPFQGA